jgi:uncharacterized membrane protein YraQ (UPF0718 family)
MKIPNYLLTSLAFVGACSLIIMACSADNSNSTSNVNSVGKYQIAGAANLATFHVIDTETGVVKTYVKNSTTYVLDNTTITQP